MPEVLECLGVLAPVVVGFGISSGYLIRHGDLVPDREGLVSIGAEVDGGFLMALKVEKVGDGFMNGETLLGLSR